MNDNKKLWLGRAVLLGLTSVALVVLLLVAADFMGVAPNLGLRFGYYGRLNRVLARVESNPQLEVLRVDLHRDMTLEDFYITVRTATDGDVRLRFEGADQRPFHELLEELAKVGM